jgi:hypothetical protein
MEAKNTHMIQLTKGSGNFRILLFPPQLKLTAIM